MKQLTFFLLMTMPCWLLAQNDFVKAEKLFLQEKYSVAKPLFENYLNDNPTNMKTLEYLGDIEGTILLR